MDCQNGAKRGADDREKERECVKREGESKGGIELVGRTAENETGEGTEERGFV